MNPLDPLAREGKINEDAGIRDRQSIIINAHINKVWAIVSDIEKWPEWNIDIKIDRFSELQEQVPFVWQINGQSIKSTIQRIEEPYLLTWTSKSPMTKAVNVWKLEDAGDSQTIVSLEESIQGLITVFFGHQKLHNILTNWLARLKQKAEE